MTMPYLAEVVAAEHGADLRREARAAHLAALACCRPTAWVRGAGAAHRAVARLRNGLRPGRRGVSCCA